MTLNQTSVSLDDAQRVIAAGQSKAVEIESPSNIAVVDAGGNLVAHVRMDGAWIGSIDISINKAFTARALDTLTEDLAPPPRVRANSSMESTPPTAGAS